MLIVHEAECRTQPGQKIGRVTVLGREFRIRSDVGELEKRVVGQCECGRIKTFRINVLIRSKNPGCGFHTSSWSDDPEARRQRRRKFRTNTPANRIAVGQGRLEEIEEHGRMLTGLAEREMPPRDEWRGVNGWTGYRVNAWGEVQSNRRTHGRWVYLKQTKHHTGYLTITVADKMLGQRQVKVHRLVAEAFLGSSEQQVRHLNGDAADNRLVNLFYGNAKQNADDRSAHGQTASGIRNGSVKLSEGDVEEIRARFDAGESSVSIASWFGISKSHVNSIGSGRSWKHVAN